MRLDGANLEAITRDFDAAMAGLSRLAAADPALWSRARPGGWTAGQHVAHIAVALEVVAAGLEDAERRWIAGTLRRPPRRGLLQALFVRLVVARGSMPRGARTVPGMEPGDAGDRDAVLARLAHAAGRHHALARRVAPEAADRIWTANPFRPAWHYRLPEALRMQAVHARHHAVLIDEIARDPAAR